jgi:Xaa-Pro dipeptidase
VRCAQEGLAAGRPVRGCDVDDACRNVIAAAGFGDRFIHRTGHSIHTSVHGNGTHIDNLETHDERPLLPRTCFSVEPGIYLPGEFGIRTEIDVFVRDARTAVVTGIPAQTEIVNIV